MRSATTMLYNAYDTEIVDCNSINYLAIHALELALSYGYERK